MFRLIFNNMKHIFGALSRQFQVGINCILNKIISIKIYSNSRSRPSICSSSPSSVKEFFLFQYKGKEEDCQELPARRLQKTAPDPQGSFRVLFRFALCFAIKCAKIFAIYVRAEVPDENTVQKRNRAGRHARDETV